MEWINLLSRKRAATPPQSTYNNRYEHAACEYLLEQGLTLQIANYRCRQGEIDLVMQHSDTLVFIEVRYRKNVCYGSAIDSVTATKRKKIIRAAHHYLQHRQQRYNNGGMCRFDVIGVSPNRSNAASNNTTIHNQDFTFDWIPNAFCT